VHPVLRRALPYWLILFLLTAILKVAGANSPSLTGGRILSGVEPIVVIRAILLRPKQLGQVILCLGLPTLARRTAEQDPILRDDLNLADYFWALSVGVRYHSPQETLRAGLPILGLRPQQAIPRIKLADAHPPANTSPLPVQRLISIQPEPAAVSNALGTVLIYHTHTSESYQPISGRDHLENGTGDIVRVGNYLADALQTQGFTVKHDRTINDQVPFRNAYGRSLRTAEKLLSEEPDPTVLIDLHRDATPGVVGSVVLGGEKVARIALVIGSDGLGLPHPHWRDNLAFANEIRDTAERMYPNLIVRIDVQEARYNQHLNPRALIIEIGNNEDSTLQEVYRAAACLALVLAEMARADPRLAALASPK